MIRGSVMRTSSARERRKVPSHKRLASGRNSLGAKTARPGRSGSPANSWDGSRNRSEPKCQRASNAGFTN